MFIRVKQHKRGGHKAISRGDWLKDLFQGGMEGRAGLVPRTPTGEQ